MPGPCSNLTIFLACVLLIAGCLGPTGSPTGGSTTTLPTNEPTPLPVLQPVSFPSIAAIPTPAYETVPVTYAAPVYSPSATVTPYRNLVHPYGQNGYVPYQLPGSTPSSSAVPEPSNPADIIFRHYSDQYFGVDYPSDWKITQANYVRFTSASGRVTFTAEVNDFPSGLAGNYRLNPDISAVQDMVSHEFPRYTANNIISDYQNTMVNGIPATVYSVRLPDASLSYTRYILVTLHHTYQFTFTADTATFDEIAPLRNYLFGTLTVSDQAA